MLPSVSDSNSTGSFFRFCASVSFQHRCPRWEEGGETYTSSQGAQKPWWQLWIMEGGMTTVAPITVALQQNTISCKYI
jgi:hypothetical protein